MHWEQSVQYASLTDVGLRRRNNQDSFAVRLCTEREEWTQRGHLLLVADGMGGHAVGELASKLAADTLPHAFFKDTQSSLPDALRLAVENANRVINERGAHNREFENMGTTCSALVLSPAGALIGHVGDSRVYRIRRGRIDQLTFDHSLQWELIRLGRVSPEEVMLHQPKNVITRSLGPDPEVDVDVEGPHRVLSGDTYVLCSDGLTGHVHDEEIGAIASVLEPTDACKLLVNLANLRGGTDNITVIVARVTGTVESPEAEAPVQFDEPDVSLPFDASWKTLAMLWLHAIVFVSGVALALLGRVPLGATVISISLIGVLVGLALRWRVMRRTSRTPRRPTRPNDPYRTASAKLTRRFLGEIAALEAELERSAIEESWTVDWAKHTEISDQVQTALEQKRMVEAFHGYAILLDLLMTAVNAPRRGKT